MLSGSEQGEEETKKKGASEKKKRRRERKKRNRQNKKNCKLSLDTGAAGPEGSFDGGIYDLSEEDFERTLSSFALRLNSQKSCLNTRKIPKLRENFLIFVEENAFV